MVHDTRHVTKWVLISIGLSLVISRIIASRVLPVYDDAFITFRYARNLAMGNGLVYYPGDLVLGTTAPLFAIFSSLIHMLRLPLPQTIVGINILCDLAILYVAVATMPQRDRFLFGVLFGTAFAVSPILSRVCVGAMEANLFLLCSVASIALYVRSRKTAAAAIAAVAYFLRPEALLLLALLGAVEWFVGKKSVALRLLLLVTVIIGLPLCVLYLVYGHVLPQSVMAKSAEQSSLVVVLKQFLTPDPFMVALLPVAVWGFIVGVRNAGFQRLTALWGAAYIGAYAVGTPKMWSWYGEPVYFCIVYLATLGAMNLVGRVRAAVPMIRRIAPVLVALPTACWVLLFVMKGESATTKNIYVPLKDWCAQNVHDDTTILASDIGVIGYYSNARIYDAVGLVWPEALLLPSVREMVLQLSPDLLFLNATQYTARMMSQREMQELYTPVLRLSNSGRGDLSLDPAKFPAHWIQDYIVFARRPAL